jgi:predicted phage terminase large subunit-like protein
MALLPGNVGQPGIRHAGRCTPPHRCHDNPAADQKPERDHRRSWDCRHKRLHLRKHHLSPKFIARVVRKYEGTRLGRQELAAELLEDVPGALWSRARIDELRIKPDAVPQLQRVVIAIDPAVTSGEDADETGIVAAGIGADGHGYVLDDVSGVLAPNDWAREAIGLYRARRADRIVAEVNNGGEMVAATLRVVDGNIPFTAVHASRGKVIRAEPISALYEQGRVHHVGTFPVLEDQMCAFTSDFDRARAGYSPDRMDALVWALTELAVSNSGADAWIKWAADLATGSFEASPIAAETPNNRPWRPEHLAQQDGGDLMAIYLATSRALMIPQHVCRSCRRPILENTHVFDGVDTWHVACAR